MSAQGNKFNPPASEMTLLDHFAGLAMQSMVSKPIPIRDTIGFIQCHHSMFIDHEMSRLAYDIAGAMLAEREKRNHAE